MRSKKVSYIMYYIDVEHKYTTKNGYVVEVHSANPGSIIFKMHIIWSRISFWALSPVRRHVWRWTSERERDKSAFGVASMPGLSGFRDNETGHACANVVTPPSTLVNLVTIGSLATHQILTQLGTRILRYGDGGARAHVQRCPHPTHDLWKART